MSEETYKYYCSQIMPGNSGTAVCWFDVIVDGVITCTKDIRREDIPEGAEVEWL